MASPSTGKKGTNIIMRQGQTASVFGNDPTVDAKIKGAEKPRDLKA